MSALTAQELKQAIDSGQKVRLLDVREPAEYTSELGHIAGSELVPLGSLAPAAFAGEAREIICICKSGMRAGKAAQALAAAGLKTRVLTGGMIAWNEAKLPITR